MKQLQHTRTLLKIMTAGLIISGLTVFPVNAELNLLGKFTPANSALGNWLHTINFGYAQVHHESPWLLYGYDWLAFAHFILAILFAGAIKDPVRNIWVIEFGMIASILIFPTAFIAGNARGIPVLWQLIDCSFGISGLLILGWVYHYLLILQKQMLAGTTPAIGTAKM